MFCQFFYLQTCSKGESAVQRRKIKFVPAEFSFTVMYPFLRVVISANHLFKPRRAVVAEMQFVSKSSTSPHCKICFACIVSVCKFFITELQRKLDETAKSKAVIETGYSFDEKKRKKTPIKFS